MRQSSPCASSSSEDQVEFGEGIVRAEVFGVPLEGGAIRGQGPVGPPVGLVDAAQFCVGRSVCGVDGDGFAEGLDGEVRLVQLRIADTQSQGGVAVRGVKPARMPQHADGCFEELSTVHGGRGQPEQAVGERHGMVEVVGIAFDGCAEVAACSVQVAGLGVEVSQPGMGDGTVGVLGEGVMEGLGGEAVFRGSGEAFAALYVVPRAGLSQGYDET